MAPLVKPYAPETPAEIVADDGRRLAVPAAMTVAEFCAFPWPAMERWELIEGTPIMAPSPFGRHQVLLSELVALLKTHLAHALIAVEYDVRLPSGEAYVRPDVMALRDDDAFDPNAVPYEGLPLLVVEVLSPSSAALDLGAKRDAYARAGVPEYWVVDPQTGALSIHELAATSGGAAYRQVTGDAEGFVVSPALGRGLRIRPNGNRYRIDTRDA